LILIFLILQVTCGDDATEERQPQQQVWFSDYSRMTFSHERRRRLLSLLTRMLCVVIQQVQPSSFASPAIPRPPVQLWALLSRSSTPKTDNDNGEDDEVEEGMYEEGHVVAMLVSRRITRKKTLR